MASPFCALCLGEIVGTVHREPLGKDDEMVNVCAACATEHPRSGRYAFAECAKSLNTPAARTGVASSRLKNR